MTNFNKCRLRIVFTLGKCNNKLMKIFVDNQELIPFENDKNITAVYESNIILPTEIPISTSGKDSNVDTIIDSDGNILEDLYAQITEVSLDNFELNENFLFKKIIVNTEFGDTYTTCYIGFNGLINLKFNEDNVFSQVLECNG